VTPDAVVDRIEDFDAARFEEWGVRGVALDLDNTIVPWHTAMVTPGATAWIHDVLRRGIGVCLITNNYAGGAAATSALFSVPLIKGALKPSPWSFHAALRVLGVSGRSAAVVGDQLFTDVLGGKLAGMRAVLVKPLSSSEFPTTKIVRMLERPMLAALRRRGLIAP
jgi:HAD superfamily phosphatase (TIGR01668 family)